MTDTVYQAVSKFSAVYHADRDCFQIQDHEEVEGFPREAALQVPVLTPCESCVVQGGVENQVVSVCPECDTTKINIRVNKPKDERFICYRCSETFREPDHRSARNSTNNLHGLARELSDGDSEEVSR
jgi:hypothetical protein